MKFFKIFKKKVTRSEYERDQKSNLVCNIHWAAVQKELSGESSFSNNTNALRSHRWNSETDDTESSERNSWSSISLSSSKTNSAGEDSVFPDCGFSRASTPSTEAIKSSMMDDISLEDVEQFEEARLAKVRRKVSRVDSLKKFLFSSRLESRLEEKIKKNKSNSNMQNLRRPALNTMCEPGYHPSCLEVHDRWVGVRNKNIEDEDDNVSRKVNINMDIGQEGRKVSRSHSQPSHRVRDRVTQRDQNLKMTVLKAPEENLGVIITSSTNTNGFIIAHIDPHSVIYRDGRFRTGDKIVRINGHDLLELTINEVREILKFSGNKVDIEVTRSEKPGRQQTKLSKSESLRIFRATPVSKSSEQEPNKGSVVTERIITAGGGNLTKTIITLPSQPLPPAWTTVDIDIDSEQQQQESVEVHHVKLRMRSELGELGLVLDGGRDEGIFVCSVIPGSVAGSLTYPGLQQG